MDIQLADVTLHIDEALSKERRADIEASLRGIDGVVSVSNPDKTPHLTIVEYNPEKTNSHSILDCVKGQGVHAELIGF